MPKQNVILQAVAAYVPAHVVQRALKDDPPRPGEAEPIKVVVLFADIAGFTTMSERMVRAQAPDQGHRGSEELNHLINQTFSALMQPVVEFGGIVTRFSGDALTAYFEHTPDATAEHVLTCALACANAMQEVIKPCEHAQVGGHTFPINVKIGLGYGPALRLTVGDAQQGLESVLAGPAVDEAALAEKHAQQGEIAIRQAALNLLPSQPEAQQRGEFALLIGQVSNDCKLSVPEPAWEQAEQDRLLAALSPYLPSQIYNSLSLTGGELPGEFRRVTSIFVGFEGLQFDSPEVGPLLQAYFVWAQHITMRFKGRLNRVITGDKGSVLHVLFGAPDKHDDDPVRALRCALALQNDPGRPKFIHTQRIGIASGIVLARPIGSMMRREYTVIGDEINLSSRLMTSSAPGEILVDTYTRDRTAQRFDFATLPPLQLKGKSLPVKAYRLLAERQTATGLTARYLSSRWALAGRDTEREILIACAQKALAGQGNTVTISGRAGVGKTRLVEEVVRHWIHAGGNGYIGQSLSHGANSPYLPWIDLWRVFFDFLDTDDANARWQKVETVITHEVSAMAQWAGILGAVLGLPAPESQSIAGLDAADRRRKLFDLALELIRAHAAHQALLLLFEDLHWTDHPSLDLIDHIAAHIDDVPVLLCLCYRPRSDLDLQAFHSPNYTQITLDELSPESSIQMIQAILNQAKLPAEFERKIYEKTQGNPLFVEELLKSLVESNVLTRSNGGYNLVGDLTRAQVPDTLQDLLMARLDRLEPPSRDLLQVASVIDRRFAYATLHNIYPYSMPDLEMRDRLEASVQADLTRLDHPEPDLAYLFKHAMTYEVTYNSLPFARRRRLHECIGDLIEVTHADDLEQYYPALARHFGQSERWDKTLVYALAAGSQAQELYANDEALSYYAQAERCLQKLPQESFWRDALRLYLNRARIYRLSGQYDLGENDINRALALSQTYNDKNTEAEACNILAEMRYWQERNKETLQTAQLAYSLASQLGNNTEKLNALRLLGAVHHGLAQYDQAMQYFLQAYDLIYQLDDRVTLGQILNAIGIVHSSTGNFENALQALHRALELLEAADLKHRMASCLSNIGLTQFRNGQIQQAVETYQRSIQIALDGGFQVGAAYTCHSQAEASSHLGEYAQALTKCHQALTFFRETGDKLGEAFIQILKSGDINSALALEGNANQTLEAALRITREHGNIEQSMYALFYLAEYKLRDSDLDAAAEYLRQIDKLSQNPLPMWPLSVKFCLEARLAWAQGNLKKAIQLVEKAENLVKSGSDPDVLGAIWILYAQIAHKQGNDSKAYSCLERTVQIAHTQSSFINKLYVLKKAGAILINDFDSKAVALGKQCLDQVNVLESHIQAEREKCAGLLANNQSNKSLHQNQ